MDLKPSFACGRYPDCPDRKAVLHKEYDPDTGSVTSRWGVVDARGPCTGRCAKGEGPDVPIDHSVPSLIFGAHGPFVVDLGG